VHDDKSIEGVDCRLVGESVWDCRQGWFIEGELWEWHG
jgi:hypothetical protein